MDVQEQVLLDIKSARAIADQKWGTEESIPFFNFASDDRILTILTEEVGEVARALLDGDPDNLRLELLDIAQVVTAWLERIEHARSKNGDS